MIRNDLVLPTKNLFHAFKPNCTMPQTTEWSRVLVQAGAQYAVSTSKHHEGYLMWNSTNIATSWHWNVIDVGSKRDLLGELANTPPVRKRDDPSSLVFIIVCLNCICAMENICRIAPLGGTLPTRAHLERWRMRSPFGLLASTSILDLVCLPSPNGNLE